MSLALRDPGGDADEDVLARHHRRRDRLTTLAIGVLTVDHDQWAPRRAEQRSAWVNAAHALSPMVNVRFVFRCGTWAMSPLYDAAARESYRPSEGPLSPIRWARR